MARPKKTKAEFPGIVEVTPKTFEQVFPVIPTPITLLSVDYPSEGLNNMARKINEIAEYINGQKAPQN